MNSVNKYQVAEADSPRNWRFAWLLCLAGALITLAILAMQWRLRSALPDPQQVPIFIRLFAFEDFPATIFLLAAILLIAPLALVQGIAARLAFLLGKHPIVTAVSVFPILCAGALLVYQSHPLAMDESTPYLQSRIFAAGHLLGRVRPELIDWLVYRPFQGVFIQVARDSGEIASAYWPGYALLLAPFTAMGIPWACNAVLGATAVWVTHRLTFALTESVEAAGTAALFTLASAAFVINSISFYSMTAHLLCNAIFALLLLRPTPSRALAAGLVGGLALTLHNPVPHALFALPWVLWLLRERQWRVLGLLVAGYLPWVVLVGFGWRYMIDGLTAVDSVVPDSVPEGMLGRMISLLGQVIGLPGWSLLWDRTLALAKLWLWSTPLLLLLAGAGFWRHRADHRVRLLFDSAALTFVGYLFVPVTQGHGWGFRYFHSVWFVLPILAAMALVPVAASTSNRNRARVWVDATRAGALAGLLVLVPCFAWQVHGFIKGHLQQMPITDQGTPRVVLISSGGYYSVDLVQNDPFLRSPVLRMVSRGSRRDGQVMAEHFPDLVLLAEDNRGAVWGYKRTE